LLFRCERIEGKTFSQLAVALGLTIPQHPLKRKGWVGKAIELALGATAGNKSSPDFCNLGIELKTLPINHLGKPSESTFITTIPLLTIQKQTWLTSQCYSKLKHVLWVPIEGDQRIEFFDRRVGRPILWSPSEHEASVLENDWLEFVLLISTGRLSEINASMGEFLQIRPKGADSKSLCYGFDEFGNRTLTMPRGFYLRSVFTQTIYCRSLLETDV
jgi:DNA mismatch repair protein MutH